ncbi:MAG: outer membrane beta-barrel protein [Gammaproteobacteria bacterium]
MIRPIAVLVCLPLVAVGAPATDSTVHQTVLTRPRPETDPQGMRLGAFELNAALSTGYLLDDNIFATDTDEVDDDILLVKPEAVLASGWSRHALRVGAEALIGRYRDIDSEDYDDYRVFTDGRLDLRGSKVSGALSYADLHEPRTSPDDEGGAEPTTYSLVAADLAWLYQPGALSIRPDVRFRSFSFDDQPLAPPQGDRDRDTLDFGLRVGYDITPESDLFIEGRVTQVDYDQKVDDDGFQRSSDGYEVIGGSTLDLGGKTFGEVYAGYRSWSFEDSRFEDIDGLAFGADLAWNVTGLTTLTVSVSSTIESTTIVDASGIQRTAIGLDVDHELRRNLLLYVRAARANEDFQGIDRDDELFDGSFGARYLMNRHFYIQAGVTQEKRDTSGAESNDQAYDIHRFEISLQGNL